AEADFNGVIDLIEERAWYFSGDRDTAAEQRPIPTEMQDAYMRARDRLLEKVAETDEQLMISYVEGRHVTVSELKKALRRATLKGEIVPVLCGSALRNKGVQLMLDAVIDYLPSPEDVPPVTGTNTKTGQEEERQPLDSEPLCGLVFKIVRDDYVGRLAYLRIYSGRAATGMAVMNTTRGGRQERFGRLLRMHANQREEVTEAMAGDIVACIGLKDTFTGDTLSDPNKPS